MSAVESLNNVNLFCKLLEEIPVKKDLFAFLIKFIKLELKGSGLAGTSYIRRDIMML